MTKRPAIRILGAAVAIVVTVVFLSAVARAQGIDTATMAAARDDASIYRRIELVRRAAAGLRIDGSDSDWRRIPTLTDPRGDVRASDHDLVAAAIAPREDDLWILLRTAAKPSTEPWVFCVEIDLWGDHRYDFRIELEQLGRPLVLRPHDSQERPGEAIPLPRAKVVVRHAVEMRIPYRDIAAAAAESLQPRILGEDVRPWVRMRCHTWDSRAQRYLDHGPEVAAFRLVKTPYPLDPPLPKRSSPPLEIGFPLSGRWFVVQGPFGPVTHQGIWAYDFVVFDSRGFQADPMPAKKNADHFAWDRPVLSPVDGYVARALAGFEDSPPGGEVSKPKSPNYVTIVSGQGVGVSLVHLRQGSLTVKSGDRVQVGQTIGRVGNSGRSDAPHLHLAAFRTRFSRGKVPVALKNVRVGLNPGDNDPWARELETWEPREGFFVESLAREE